MFGNGFNCRWKIGLYTMGNLSCKQVKNDVVIKVGFGENGEVKAKKHLRYDT